MTASVSAREAELHAMPLWIGTDTVPLGDWVLRTVAHAPGLKLRRTNSCLAVGDPGLALDDAIVRVRAFYDSLDRPPLAQVEAGSDVERALLGLGWRPSPDEDAPFQTASLPVALAAAGTTASAEARIEGTRVQAVVTVDGVPGGRARAELNDGWLGVHGLEVDERFRRRGLGRALMAAVFACGAEHGATTAWLEVAISNAPARRLYDGLGFTDHHTSRYLAAPTG